MPQQVTDVRTWPRVELRGVEFHPMMSELLGEECPVRVALPQGGEPAWVFTHYDDVKAVTADPRFSRAAVREADSTRLTQLRPLLEGDLTYQDGDAHTRIRRQLAKALTPARIEVLDRVSARICDSLMDAVLAQGPPADLVADLVSPYALELTGRLVGVPEQHRDKQLCEHFETVFSIRSAPEQARAAQDALRQLFQELVSAARAVRPGTPGVGLGGLITALAGPEAELTDQEAVAAAYHVTQAAWHGIRNQGGNLLYVLLSRPDLAAWLRGRPEAWPAAIDELLRYTPRLAGLGVERIATEDVTVGGVTVRRGEAVYVSYASANRDERAFPDPSRIDLRRRGNQHLAYGHGPHRCPASALGDMELRTLVGTLLTRLPTARLAVPDEELAWRTADILRGPQQLPVTW